MEKFPGQGLNPGHSCSPSHSNDARSLIHHTTREVQIFFKDTFFLGQTHGMQTFPGQGSNLHHNSEPEPEQWQHQILNLLLHQGTPINFNFRGFGGGGECGEGTFTLTHWCAKLRLCPQTGWLPRERLEEDGPGDNCLSNLPALGERVRGLPGALEGRGCNHGGLCVWGRETRWLWVLLGAGVLQKTWCTRAHLIPATSFGVAVYYSHFSNEEANTHWGSVIYGLNPEHKVLE